MTATTTMPARSWEFRSLAWTANRGLGWPRKPWAAAKWCSVNLDFAISHLRSGGRSTGWISRCLEHMRLWICAFVLELTRRCGGPSTSMRALCSRQRSRLSRMNSEPSWTHCEGTMRVIFCLRGVHHGGVLWRPRQCATWQLRLPLVLEHECGDGQVLGFTDEAITYATALEGLVDLRLEISGAVVTCESAVLATLPAAIRDAVLRMHRRGSGGALATGWRLRGGGYAHRDGAVRSSP